MFDELKQKMLKVCRTAYMKGHVAGTKGSLSVRSPDGNGILIKATCVHFWDMTEDDILFVNWERGTFDSNTMAPTARRPSVETLYHLGIYSKCPAAGAVIHTHSPCVTALTFTHSGELPLVTESVKRELRCVPIVDIQGMPRPDAAAAVADAFSSVLKVRAAAIKGQGLIAADSTIEGAYDAVDLLEHSCVTLSYVQDDTRDAIENGNRSLHDCISSALDALDKIRSEIDTVRRYVYEEFKDPGFIHGRLKDLLGR